MITVEEINKRLKAGPEEKKPYDWEPKRPDHPVKTPKLKVVIPESNNGPKTARERFSKILAFIDEVKAKRYKEGCTVMPISTHSKKLLRIWNSSKGVSLAIDKMIEAGLIEIEDPSFRHHAPKQIENHCKTYLYFADVEREIINYCKENKIEKFVPDSTLKIDQRLKRIIDSVPKTFDKSKVRFSIDLDIVKPEGLSVSEFEDYLTYCLYENYPYLRLVQLKIKEINEYYKTDVEQNFKMEFEPTFKWCEEKGRTNVLEGITIRATNAYSNRKKIKRYWTKKKEELVLGHDVRSSVPRITLSLNSGHWVSEKEIGDIYKLISEAFDSKHKYTNARREAIKKLHMFCYFSGNVSSGILGNYVWWYMKKEDAKKPEVNSVLGELREAIIKAEGGKLYDVEVFFVESCLYVMTLYDLLKAGIKTWLVYDAFYSKEFDDQEYLKQIVP